MYVTDLPRCIACMDNEEGKANPHVADPRRKMWRLMGHFFWKGEGIGGKMSLRSQQINFKFSSRRDRAEGGLMRAAFFHPGR